VIFGIKLKPSKNKPVETISRYIKAQIIIGIPYYNILLIQDADFE